MFLVRTLQPWFTNELKRLVKTPKLPFLDSRLLAALRGANASRLERDRMSLGPLLESFVLAEILKLASWFDEPSKSFIYATGTDMRSTS